MKVAGVFLIIALCTPALIFSGVSLEMSARDGLSAAQSQAKKGPPKKDEPEQDNPKGQTAISVSVNLVNLQALVTDKKGNIITGLQPDNFTVYEDNVKQDVSHFATVDAGITSVMLVDFSKMVDWFIEDVWNSIYGFAETLRPGDWTAVIGYDLRPTILTDFTQKRSELMDALSRFNTPAFRESNLCDALIFTLDRVEEIDGKVAILLVSTGLDTFSQHTWDDALNKCKASNASVYAISVGQSVRLRYNIDNIEWVVADNRLRSIAELTGENHTFPVSLPNCLQSLRTSPTACEINTVWPTRPPIQSGTGNSARSASKFGPMSITMASRCF